MSSVLTPVLLAIHMMVALALIGVVLLQRSEGGIGGLGGGGMSGFMTTRGSANLLTRTTRWLAGAFMALSLVLAWIAAHENATRTAIPTEPTQVEAPEMPAPDQSGAPATPSAGGESQAPAAPSAPAVPTSQ